MLTDLRPTNMAEAFISAYVAVPARRRRTGRSVCVKVLNAIQKPGVGLVDNNTGRAPRKERK